MPTSLPSSLASLSCQPLWQDPSGQHSLANLSGNPLWPISLAKLYMANLSGQPSLPTPLLTPTGGWNKMYGISSFCKLEDDGGSSNNDVYSGYFQALGNTDSSTASDIYGIRTNFLASSRHTERNEFYE